MIVDSGIKSMENNIKNKYSICEKEYTKNIALLDSYSPLKTLARGYSVASNLNTGLVIKNKDDVKKGDLIDIKVQDGKIEAEVV